MMHITGRRAHQEFFHGSKIKGRSGGERERRRLIMLTLSLSPVA
jgi:hypothetical protein